MGPHSPSRFTLVSVLIVILQFFRRTIAEAELVKAIPQAATRLQWRASVKQAANTYMPMVKTLMYFTKFATDVGLLQILRT